MTIITSMMAVELERRLGWKASMRVQLGYGEEQQAWLKRMRRSGVWTRWRQQAGPGSRDWLLREAGVGYVSSLSTSEEDGQDEL